MTLVALYLRGAPNRSQVPHRRWEDVARVARTVAPPMNLEEALARCGLWQESAALSTPGLVRWAHERLASGEALTAACPDYPLAWIRALGCVAPPALWREGSIPSGPFLGVVGSREASAQDRAWARSVAEAAVRLGYCVVGGGAGGTDSEAAEGAVRASSSLQGAWGGQARLVEMLPCGLAQQPSRGRGCRLSLSPPWAPFAAAQAHERNALVYAMAEATVVVRARFREGGAWAGAVEALRRRWGRVLVQWDAKDRACRALAALGATPVRDATGLQTLLASSVPGSPVWRGNPRAPLNLATE